MDDQFWRRFLNRNRNEPYTGASMITREIRGGKTAVLAKINELIEMHTIDPNISSSVYTQKYRNEQRNISKGLKLARGIVEDCVDLDG